jgi:hypothetical protein
MINKLYEFFKNLFRESKESDFPNSIVQDSFESKKNDSFNEQLNFDNKDYSGIESKESISNSYIDMLANPIGNPNGLNISSLSDTSFNDLEASYRNDFHHD